MTRKDYIKIARTLKEGNKSNMLAQDNDKFDRERFLFAVLGE